MAKAHIPMIHLGTNFQEKNPNFETENYVSNERSRILALKITVSRPSPQYIVKLVPVQEQ